MTAAHRLGVNHSTLSRRIAALEAAFGVPLFERRTVGFVLTPEGERLLDDAESIETLALRMRITLDANTTSLTGTVRFGMPEGFGTYFMAPCLKRLREAQKNLDIELVANPRSFSLTKREADLAVTMSRPSHGRVYAEKLVDYKLGLYAAPSYLAGLSRLSKPQDLANLCWIGYVEDLMWTPELNYIPQISRDIRPQLKVSNVITQMMAISGGAGIGVLPNFMVSENLGLVKVLPEQVELTRSYWLVSHADTRDLARISFVISFLKQELINAGPAFWM